MEPPTHYDNNNTNSLYIQKEVSRAILNLEDKLAQKHLEYDSKITTELSKLEFQLTNVIKKQDDFFEFTQLQLIHNQKQDDILQFIDKINDQLTNLDIRIKNNAKELNDAIYKYDYLYLNNLLLPGHIGESCKFKNLREFLDYAITRLSSFDTYKEKQSVDLKSYKERLETLIKGFNMQIDRIKNSNMAYANEKVFELKESFSEQIKDLYANLPEIQMKNHQYVIKLKMQFNELIKDREMISKMKDEFLLDMNTKCDQIKEDNQNTNNQIGEYKTEFAKIKRSYLELAEFIKDVRFKRNINSEISKDQLKKLATKLSKEREKLSEDQIEECHQRKVDDVLDKIIKNDDIKHLTSSQTSRGKDGVKGGGGVGAGAGGGRGSGQRSRSGSGVFERHKSNEKNDVVGLDSIVEGESLNMTVVLDENNKDNTTIDNNNNNLKLNTEGNNKKTIEHNIHKRPMSSFSSNGSGRLETGAGGGTSIGFRNKSLTHYSQPVIKQIIEGNEKRFKEIEELTQAKIKALENRINNIQIKDTAIVQVPPISIANGLIGFNQGTTLLMHQHNNSKTNNDAIGLSNTNNTFSIANTNTNNRKDSLPLNGGMYIHTDYSPRHSSTIPCLAGLESMGTITQQQQGYINTNTNCKNPQFFPINKRKITKIKNSSFSKIQEYKLPLFEMKDQQLKKKNKPSLNVPVSRVLSPNASNEGNKADSQTIIHAVSSHFLKPLKNCLDTINSSNPLYKP